LFAQIPRTPWVIGQLLSHFRNALNLGFLPFGVF
jgi:hypothetical protein